jgi:hypothetical protein
VVARGTHLGEHFVQPLEGPMQVNLYPTGSGGNVLKRKKYLSKKIYQFSRKENNLNRIVKTENNSHECFNSSMSFSITGSGFYQFNSRASLRLWFSTGGHYLCFRHKYTTQTIWKMLKTL